MHNFKLILALNFNLLICLHFILSQFSNHTLLPQKYSRSTFILQSLLHQKQKQTMLCILPTWTNYDYG